MRALLVFLVASGMVLAGCGSSGGATGTPTATTGHTAVPVYPAPTRELYPVPTSTPTPK